MSGYGVHISFGGKRKFFSEIWSFVECRKIGPDDWMLSPDLFKLNANKWGPFDVDRIACSYNSHSPYFNSKFWCPGTEAVDCLTQDWGKESNNFVCPPPHLISAVLYHVETCKAKGTLVVPEWRSALFQLTII